MPRPGVLPGYPGFVRLFGAQEFEVDANLADFFVKSRLIRLREHALVLAAASEQELLVHLLPCQLLALVPAA